MGFFPWRHLPLSPHFFILRAQAPAPERGNPHRHFVGTPFVVKTGRAFVLALFVSNTASSSGPPRRAAPSAPASVHGQRGESPLQACALRPVTNCNCVAARRGGEQQEVNDQSVG